MIRDIPKYEGLYATSNDGRIWSYPNFRAKKKRGGGWLKPWKIGHGYYCVSLYSKSGKSKKYLIHRLIAQTFIPNPKKLREVNHKNATITDNKPENLEWVSSSGNKQHALKMGLYKRGEGHIQSKLKNEDVFYIKSSGEFGVKLAEKYNVSPSLISRIRKGVSRVAV